jgi:hypothetical protein
MQLHIRNTAAAVESAFEVAEAEEEKPGATKVIRERKYGKF